MAGSAPTRWLRDYTEPLRPIYREVLVMSLFINLLALAVPVFILQVYDRVIFHAGLTTLQGHRHHSPELRPMPMLIGKNASPGASRSLLIFLVEQLQMKLIGIVG